MPWMSFKGVSIMMMHRFNVYDMEEDNMDRLHRHFMEVFEMLGVIVSLVWAVVGLVFFIYLMSTLGGLF